MAFLFNKHNSSKKPNVLIYSVPRSGSTWLMELIWSQPNFKPVNEPLDLRHKVNCKRSNIKDFKELYSDQVKDKMLNYFKAFATGKMHFKDTYPFHNFYRFKTSRLVYKVINGGEFFSNDIAEATNSKIVYLIRNPVAVSLSRKQLPRTNELMSDFVMSKFSAEEKEYAKAIFKNGSDMEKRIMAWCIQNKFALMYKTDKWLIVSYEELTCKPQTTLKKIVDHCNLDDINVMLKGLKVPSAVSVQSEKNHVELMKENDDKRKAMISNWRYKISEEEKSRYFDICKTMNFNIYLQNSDLPNLSD